MSVTGGSAITATDTQLTALTTDGHGLTVNQSTHMTTLTGGTNSSTLTLADDQATLGVGTATTSELTVLNATNNGTTTSVAIGGSSNSSNQLLATATGGTNTVQAAATNTLTAGTNNVLNAAQQNQLTGGTGNIITATTGNNAITAATGNNTITSAAGSNIISANAASQSNTISATGTGGTNNITANATSGSNNIEAYTNNIGVSTASSQNTIGNAGTSANVITGATNIITGATTVTSTGTANQMVVDGTSSRFVSADGAQSVAVSNSGTTITGAAGHTLDVTGTTTIISGTATIYSGNGSGNELIVDSTSARLANSTNTNSVAVNNAQTTVTGTTAINGATTITSPDSTHVLSVTNSNIQVNGGAAIYSGAGTNNRIMVSGNTDNNILAVGDTQTGTVGLNTFDYGTEVTGGMYVNGDLGVNGSIYSLNPTASATVNVANNGMTITGEENAVVLQADNDALDTNSRAKLTMDPTSAALLVNTDNGESHGITVSQTSTVISGGTTTTILTLDDNGATFADDDTGGPVTVTGVADGVSNYDAVNIRQFRSEGHRLDGRIDKAYAGIASVAAIAAVPSPVSGKNVSVGFGFGNFKDQSAIALGTKALIGKKKDVTFTAGVGYSDNTTTLSAGLGWSF